MVEAKRSGSLIGLLGASDLLEESVIYQDVMQRGEPRGALKLLLRQLERRFGKLPSQTRSQIERLPVAQLEELAIASLDFTDKSDVRTWLKQHAAELKRIKGTKAD